MKQVNRYQITAPRTPGAEPTVIDTADTLPDARDIAKMFSADRSDLKRQDVRIETLDGVRVEYAGPPR